MITGAEHFTCSSCNSPKEHIACLTVLEQQYRTEHMTLLQVVYEDEHMACVVKPQGMPTAQVPPCQAPTSTMIAA